MLETRGDWMEFGSADENKPAKNGTLDEQRISVSLATIELAGVSSGTRMTCTERGAFLDGLEDPAEREHGTNLMVHALGAALESGLGGL